jgi:hypothetical protein
MVARLTLVASFVGIGVMWLVTHIWPSHFGTCRYVPLSLGKEASVRECQAYATTDFVLPLGMAVLLLLLLGTADIKLTIPGFGTIERTREGKEAAEVLKTETQTVDERAEKFLEGLPPSDAPKPGEQP